jgi:FdhE protein
VPQSINIFELSFAYAGSKSHNRPVQNPWQQRIRRAQHLSAEFSFARQILAFYIEVARFQHDLAQRFLQTTIPSNTAPHRPPELPELLASFPAFLALVQKYGPPRLAQVAQILRQAPPEDLAEMLDQSWSAPRQTLTDPPDFIALAFLQPYAEFVRSRVPLHTENYTHSTCPFCARIPALTVLRPMGEGARRNLLCGFCLCEWEFRRIVCPGCDEKDHAKLPVFTADEFPHIRLECCDTCHTYIKSIDLSKNGLADPLVDELATVPLDLWAQERGYAKLRPNLLGM